MPKGEELTPKQRAFVEHYIACGMNATKAYMRAFQNDNEKSSGVSGHKLLKNPKVKEAIDKILEDASSKRIASSFEVLEQLTLVMYDKEAKDSDRLKAMELLGRKHKLFTDKMEMDSNVEVEINLTGLGEEE